MSCIMYIELVCNLKFSLNICDCYRDSALEDVCIKLCVCNAVRDALEGGVLSVSFHQLLLKPSKNIIGFLLEV